MICRIWRGWTTPQNADVYEALLREEIFPGIIGRAIAGFVRIELGRANGSDEAEFVTIMWFDTIEAIKAFAGADYETAVVPPRARAVLKRFDAHSTTRFATAGTPPRQKQSARVGSACPSFRWP